MWHMRYFPVDSESDVGSYEGIPPRVGDTVTYRTAEGSRRKVTAGEIVIEAEYGVSFTYVYVESPEAQAHRENKEREQRNRQIRQRNRDRARVRRIIEEARAGGWAPLLPGRLRGIDMQDEQEEV